MLQGDSPWLATAFETRLGWIALVLAECAVVELSFGHPSPRAALAALRRGELENLDVTSSARIQRAVPGLIVRLRAFAAGKPTDFSDVPVECGTRTDFARRVVQICRQVPSGATLTYGEVADMADAPRAARAVGNVMASNPVPLIVPCHRIVAAGGKPGRYSAGEGTRTKLRLLEMEALGRVKAPQGRPRVVGAY